MIRIVNTSILLFCFFVCLSAQKNPVRCAHDTKVKPWMQKTPGYEEKIYQGFEEFNKGTSGTRQNGGVIPVHVIIIHPPGQIIGTGQNFSLEHILSQIEVLNRDFGRYNADTLNTPPVFTVEDTGIQFCLANTDPDGNPSNGITRYAFNGDFDDNELMVKQATGWPRNFYLNIWSAPEIEDLGYAYIPSQTFLPNPVLDGVVVNSATFGGPGYGTLAPYHLGRTVTHEVGHYLGLLHTWFEVGCTIDDGIQDTPSQDDENFGCPVHPSPSCNNQGDMFMNYMDYVNDNCMNAFSADQGAYMRSILSGIRSTLLDSNNTACYPLDSLNTTVITQDNLCFGDLNGRILAQASGGMAPYQFLLGNGNTNDTGIFDGLAAGNYTLVVTDATNQIDSIHLTVLEPDKMSLISDTLIQPTCTDYEFGKAIVYAMGGSTMNDYLYELIGGETNHTGIFENLGIGIHAIIVYDDHQCFDSINIEIFAPNPIVYDTIDFQHVLCHGDSTGKFSLVATGGSGDLEYRLENQNFSNDNRFTGLTEGKYIFEIRDTHHCVIRDSVDIIQPHPILVQIEIIDSLRCPGDSSAAVQLLASGGNPPYLYTFDNIENHTSHIFENLVSGNYRIIVTDDHQCQHMSELLLPDPLEITIGDTILRLPDCDASNGEIIVTAMGGTGNQYVYRIGNFQYPEGKFTGLKKDMYTLTIYDENQCSQSFEILLKENTDLLIQEDSIVHVHCYGDNTGEAVVSGQNGLGNLMYQLGNIIQQTGYFTGLYAGAYTAQVTDSAGCKQQTTIIINEPDSPLVLNILDIVHGNNPGEGKIEVEAQGGIPPYGYSLDGIVFSSNNRFSELEAGTFVVYAQDSSGCIVSVEVNISNLEQIHRNQTKVWPNPVSDILYISAKENTIDHLSLFNLLGQKIKDPVALISHNPGGIQYILNVESIPAGWYFLVVSKKGEKVYHVPVVKL